MSVVTEQTHGAAPPGQAHGLDAVEVGANGALGSATPEAGDRENAPQGLIRREASATASAALSAWSGREGEVQNPTSSAGEINLDGVWVTAAGTKLTIKGNSVTGPAGYKEVIVIKSGGRRVEMLHSTTGVAYWAILVGRGSLNWNDGDLWWRQVDCEWTPWWNVSCGGPCGSGNQQRRREYRYVQENGGQPCNGLKEDCFSTSACAPGDNGGNTTNSTRSDAFRVASPAVGLMVPAAIAVLCRW